MPVEEDEERRRRGRRFSTDDKRKERLKFEGQGEACSSTEMRGMKELAQSREMTQSGMKALCDL